MIKTLNSRLWDHRCKWWVCKKKEEFRLFSPVNVRLQSQSDDTICFILNVPEAHQLCISLVPEMRLWSTPRCDSSALINPPKTGLTVMKTSTILILCKVCVHWSSLGKHPAKDGDIRGKSYSFHSNVRRRTNKKPIITWEDLKYPDNKLRGSSVKSHSAVSDIRTGWAALQRVMLKLNHACRFNQGVTSLQSLQRGHMSVLDLLEKRNQGGMKRQSGHL